MSGPYCLLAVDEMYNYRTKCHDRPTVLKDKTVRANDFAFIISPIQGREDIIIFETKHIEVWNKINVVQDRGPLVVSPAWMWCQPNIFFWQVGQSRPMEAFPTCIAQRLQGWWKVSDDVDYDYWCDPKK